MMELQTVDEFLAALETSESDYGSYYMNLVTKGNELLHELFAMDFNIQGKLKDHLATRDRCHTRLYEAVLQNATEAAEKPEVVSGTGAGTASLEERRTLIGQLNRATAEINTCVELRAEVQKCLQIIENAHARYYDALANNEE